MIKKLLKTVSVLIIVALVLAGIFFYSIFVSVENLTVSYHTIQSEKIPSDMNDIQIAFITDLEYNHFMNKERLTKMIHKINEVKPDIILFGGDIFDLPLTYVPNDATKQEVSQLLKMLQAPLGKFAVLGEQDNVDKNVRDMVIDILKTSDFELLNNRSIRLRNGSQASITLIGLDSLIGGTIDVNNAFSNVNQEEFNILLTHCPDTITLEDLPSGNIDLMFAGHSHGAQIYVPLLGALSSDEGAKKYNHGKHTINQTILHVSNGLGTTAMDMRLFSPPQMLVYRLRSEEKKTEPKNDQSETKETEKETKNQ
ncbi:metallophosphoesterase [bacterium c-19]|nr:metallophosphoesterase [bacterium c-19]